MSDAETTDSDNVSFPRPDTGDERDGETFREWLRENRDWIEMEAESDAPDAWVFDRLRQFLDSVEDGDS